MKFGLVTIESAVQGLRQFIDEHLPNISAETLGWLATVIHRCTPCKHVQCMQSDTCVGDGKADGWMLY